MSESDASATEWQEGCRHIGSFIEQFLRKHPDGESRLLEWLKSVPEERTDAEYQRALEQNLLTFDDLPPDVARVMPAVYRFLCTHWEGARLLNEWCDSVPVGVPAGLPPDVAATAMRITRLLPTILSRLRAGTAVREIASEFELDEVTVQSIADVQARKLKALS